MHHQVLRDKRNRGILGSFDGVIADLIVWEIGDDGSVGHFGWMRKGLKYETFLIVRVFILC